MGKYITLFEIKDLIHNRLNKLYKQTNVFKHKHIPSWNGTCNHITDYM